MSSKPVIVITPGAWHTPAAFRTLRAELGSRGWETAATTNVSVGAEPPTMGFSDDAASARGVIAALVEQGRDVVVVAHSYGGVVAAEAVKGLARRRRAEEGREGGVVAFLYVAAFVAPAEASVWSLTEGNIASWMDVRDGKIICKTPADVFYGSVPRELLDEVVPLVQHQSAQAFAGVVTYEPWRDIPCGYIACSEDRAVPFFAQEQMAGLLGPRAVRETFETAHSPFLSMTRETADVVERMARKGVEEVEV
ncbi:hypothetical protein CTRI78_v000802 [Colletotrichum trifolii]|uniref:AB hydrolase-1 domain-containing protein n=1 Tax=Colletotrichum trifolii TaxID=5466 RepID=A0A4R8RQW9_COLTR|nr:hypothetical protein CTRI78_v000802 [Colletotrichum trifolii]